MLERDDLRGRELLGRPDSEASCLETVGIVVVESLSKTTPTCFSLYSFLYLSYRLSAIQAVFCNGFNSCADGEVAFVRGRYAHESAVF